MENLATDKEVNEALSECRTRDETLRTIFRAIRDGGLKYVVFDGMKYKVVLKEVGEDA